MKKYITMVSFARITVFIFMLFTTFVNAQTDLPGVPDDTVVAPIDDYVWVLTIAGVIFAFIRYRAILAKNE